MATPEMVNVMYVLGLMKRMGRRKMAITANLGSHAFLVCAHRVSLCSRLRHR